MRTDILITGHGPDLEVSDSNHSLQHRVQILYELLPQTQWVHFAAILTLFGLLFKYVDLPNLLIWLGFVMSILVTRIWITRRYKLARRPLEDAGYWFNWFLIGTTLYGVMWSATAILLIPPEWPYLAGFTALILCGLAAGGVAVSSVSLKVYAAYTVSIVLPYAAFLIATNQNPYPTIGWLMAGFTIVIMIVAMHVNHFFSDLFDLQIKTALLDKEVKHENRKRQFAEKALLNNTLEEELAELIRQQSHKIRSNKDFGKISSKDKNEMQYKYFNYLEMLAGTIKSQLDSAAGFIKELNETPLSVKQSTTVNIVEKLLTDVRKTIRKLDETEDREFSAGKSTPEKINIRYMLNDISTRLPLALKAKYITLNRNYAQEIPHHLYGNKKVLWQILNELVINAAKFTDGGVIDVDVSIASDLEDRVVLVFAVRDTGAGLPKDIVEYLNNGADAERFSGTGLANVRQLVINTGGDLSAKGIPGAGTQIEFTFTFFKKDPAELKIGESETITAGTE